MKKDNIIIGLGIIITILLIGVFMAELGQIEPNQEVCDFDYICESPEQIYNCQSDCSAFRSNERKLGTKMHRYDGG